MSNKQLITSVLYFTSANFVMYNNYSFDCLGMVMTKMGKGPAPRQQSRGGSGLLSSPKWPQVAPPLLLGRRSPPPRQFPKLRLKSLPQTMRSQRHLAKLRLHRPLRDSSPQGDGGFQKRASSSKCNLNPSLPLLTVQDLQLFLQLRTC